MMTTDEPSEFDMQAEKTRLQQQLAEMELRLQAMTAENERLRARANLLLQSPMMPNTQTYLQMIIAHERLEGLVEERTAALRESQSLLQETQRIARIGGWSLDLRTSEVRWTEEMYRLYELPPDTPPSLELALAPFVVSAREQLRQAHTRLLEEGTPYEIELPFITAAGNHRWVSAQSRATYQQGQATNAFGTLQDITVRKQAEEARRASEARYRLLADYATDIISRHDADGNYLYVSPACLTILGYTSDELTGRNVFSLFHPDDVERIKATFVHVLNSSDIGRGEYRVVCKDGRSIWVESTGQSIRDPQSGEAMEIIAVSRDITERKQAEEALHRYRRIVSATPDAIALLDRNYVYQIVNDAYLRLNAKAYDEIVGHSVADLLGVDIFERLSKERLDRCLAGEMSHYQAWFSYAGAGQRFMDVTYTPYRDDQGAIVGVLVNSRDITDLKQTEEEIRLLNRDLQRRTEELENLNQELEALSYAIAHNLRTPLWTVRLCAEAVREDNAGWLNEESRKLLQTIETTVERMNQTIEQLLTLAALSREQVSIETVNLSMLAQEIAAEL